MQPNLLIDFNEIAGPVYTGRGRGEQLRVQFKLDEVDKEDRTVDVVIPGKTYSVNSSFFLGFFGESVVNCKTVDQFFVRYHFTGPPHIIERVRLYASRALQEKDLFDN